jgi:NADP-dependent 3-hydroxy acid dehydrogenase YdfG
MKILCLLLTQNNTVFGKDKTTVLITGANRGIGLEYANSLLQKVMRL